MNTNNLTDSEKIDLLIRELALLKAIVEGLFDGVSQRIDKIEDRFKDAPNIWQSINARTERIEATLLDMKEQIGTLARRDLERDAALSRLSSRISDVENRMTGD